MQVKTMKRKKRKEKNATKVKGNIIKPDIKFLKKGKSSAVEDEKRVFI